MFKPPNKSRWRNSERLNTTPEDHDWAYAHFYFGKAFNADITLLVYTAPPDYPLYPNCRGASKFEYHFTPHHFGDRAFHSRADGQPNADAFTFTDYEIYRPCWESQSSRAGKRDIQAKVAAIQKEHERCGRFGSDDCDRNGRRFTSGMNRCRSAESLPDNFFKDNRANDTNPLKGRIRIPLPGSSEYVVVYP